MFADIANLFQDGNLWAFFKDQLDSNQFSQGAIVAALVMGLISWGKEIPSRLFRLVAKLISIDMRFNSDSPDYEIASRYITKNIIKDTFSRNFVFQTETKFDTNQWRDVPDTRDLTAGYGKHFGFYKGRLVVVDRFVDESSTTEKFKEHTVITFFTRSKKTVYGFAQELASAAKRDTHTFTEVPVNINSGEYWNKMGKLPLRRMSSVFTAGNVGDKVVEAIRSFEQAKEEHHALGLPHHMGIMLHGDPGCGKSSLIHAIATETEREINYLNLGSVEADKELTRLLSGNRDWSRCILAIEDIDAAGVKVNRNEGSAKTSRQKAKKDETNPVSLSALLNVLDGILCPDGLVVIATTNHLDDIDPALKRKGRFDFTFELGQLGYEDFVRMCAMFNKDHHKIAFDPEQTMSGAAMRALIMESDA